MSGGTRRLGEAEEVRLRAAGAGIPAPNKSDFHRDTHAATTALDKAEYSRHARKCPFHGHSNGIFTQNPVDTCGLG